MTNPAIWRALNHAFDTHVGEYRKVIRIPYLIHPLRVESILCSYGFPDDPFGIAALLHDGPEHGKMDLDAIEQEFGSNVARLVRGVTPPNSSEAWEARKRASIDRLKSADTDVLVLACADKLDNVISIREDLSRLGPCLWERLGRTEEMQKWYYRSLAQLFAQRLQSGPGAPMMFEFCAEVCRVFGRALTDPTE